MRLFYGGAVVASLVSCGTNLADPELQESVHALVTTPAARKYEEVIRSYDGQVDFAVTVRAGRGVSDEAVRRLLSEMVIAAVPYEIAEPIAPRSANFNLNFGGCDTLAAVTIQAEGQSVDLARYAWTWTQDFEPVETTGVLRVAGSTCDVPDVPNALNWKWKWYGGNLMLERLETCNAVYTSSLATLAALLVIPAPWNFVAAGAIVVHDGWIFRKIGRRGVRLEFNWSGTLHRVVTRPEGTNVLPSKDRCPGVKYCGTTACMCEDHPDPYRCECLMRGEDDDC